MIVALLIGFQYPIMALGSGVAGHAFFATLVLILLGLTLAGVGLLTTLRRGKMSSGTYAGFLAGAIGGVAGGIVDSIIVSSAPALVANATNGLLGMPTTFGLEVTFCGFVMYSLAGVVMGGIGAAVGRIFYRKPQRATASVTTGTSASS